MKVIHLLRKPLSKGTVAANVLQYGTGALNIDTTRVETSDNLNGGAYAKEGISRPDGSESRCYHRGGDGEFTHPSGRWPANLILHHLAGCGGGVCNLECPVVGLDQQSGVTRSGVAKEAKVSAVKGVFVFNNRSVPGVNQHRDEGGASRYFRRVGG